MSVLQFIHLFAVAIWIGCILVEAVMETVASRDEASMKLAVTQHYYAGLLVEIPCCLTVFVTGFVLLDWAVISTALSIKIACALAAIALNLACAVAVILRQRTMVTDGFSATLPYTKAITKMSALFIPLFIIAVAYGVSFAM